MNKKRRAISIVTTFTALFAFAGCKKKVTTAQKPTTNRTTDNVPTTKEADKKTYTVTFETNGGSSINSATVNEGAMVSKPNNPTKDGFDFKGWFTDQNLTSEFNFATSINSDLKLYAKWVEKEITITFETYGGTVINPITQKYNTKIDVPTNPEKSGFFFLGWFTDSNFETRFDFDDYIMDSITLYAKYGVKNNTIAFDSMGGSEVDPIIQDAWTDVTKPTDPTRIGYTFTGWYTEKTLEHEFTFDRMPAEGIVLYAGWSLDTYTIIYHENEGVNPTANPTGVTILTNQNAIPLLPATKEDYDFLGWYTTEDFKPGTKIYNDEIPAMTLESLEIYGENKTLNLYAKYRPHEYKITYVIYGATNANVSSSNKENEAITLLDPQKDYYKFLGWYLDSEFHDEITEIPAHLDHDLTIYAKFDYVYYNINYYNCNDAINPNPTQYNIDDEITFAEPTQLGYTFKGWYKSNNHDESNRFIKIDRGTTGNVNVYAWFEPIEYSITYEDDKNFGNPTSYTIATNTFTLKNAEKEGYTFDGWYLNGVFTEENKITRIEKGSIGPIVLKPKFTIINYTINFVVDGGEEIESMTYNVESETFNLPTATPTGDTPAFRYWKNGTEVLTEIKKGRTGDLTLTAYFAEEEYTVTFVNYDDTVLQTITVGKNDTAVYTGDTPVKPYTDLCVYTFDGWDQEITSITGDIVAKAKFIEKQYLVFTLTDDGEAYTVRAEKNVALPENIVLPEEYTVEGVTLPVIGIDANGFYHGNDGKNTINIKSITIPTGYTTIGKTAFFGLRNLEELNINSYNITGLDSSSLLFQYCGVDGSGVSITFGSYSSVIPEYLFYSNSTSYSIKIKDITFECAYLNEIGKYAFYQTKIEELILPDSIEVINDFAFGNIQTLKKIHLSKNLLTIGTQILYNCSNLEEIELPFVGRRVNGEVVNNYRYFGNLFRNDTSTGANNLSANLKKVTLTNERAIPSHAFYGCQYITEITLNEEITSIGSHTFYNCLRLEKLYYNCKSASDLTGNSYIIYSTGMQSEEGLEVVFGKNVETIPAYLFFQDNSTSTSYWSKIKAFTFDPDCKVSKIGRYAFTRTRYATEFTLPKSVTEIGDYAFAYSSFTKLIIEDLDKIQSNYGFSYLSELKDIYLTKKTKNFSSYLFINCHKIKNVYYDGTVVDWMSNTYSDDYSNPMFYAKYFYIKNGDSYERVTELDLSSMDIETLNAGTFMGFEAVTKIILPDTLKELGDSVFAGMYRLKDITLPAGLTTIGSRAFDNCYSIKELVIPNSVTSIGEYPFLNCSNMTSLTLPSNLETLPIGLFRGCASLTSVTLPDNLVSLPADIFYGMTKLTSVILPESLETIGNNAFAYSGITNIVIPKNVTSIGEHAFSYTNNLNSVTFEEGTTINTIGTYAFDYSGLTSIILPDSVKVLDNYAFEHCMNLKTIDLNKVEFLGNYCFAYSGIEAINLNDNFKIATYGAFYDCEKLKTVSLGKNIEYLGEYCFYKDYYLETINYNVVKMPYSAYYGNSSYSNYRVTNIYLYAGTKGNGITVNIGDDVEYFNPYFMNGTSNENAPKIVSVNFPTNGSIKAFDRYDTNPESYCWSYDYFFQYLTSLTSIEIKGAPVITGYFMYECKNVDTITITDDVSNIDYCAFANMGNVNTVYLPNTIKKVNSSVFYETTVLNMYFNGTLDEYKLIEYNGSQEAKLHTHATHFFTLENGEYVEYIEEGHIDPVDPIDPSDIFTSANISGQVYTESNPFIIPANIKRFDGSIFSSSSQFEYKDFYFEGSLEDWCKIEFTEYYSNPMYLADHFYFKENGAYVEYNNLVIPSSIKKINRYAFMGLKNLITLDTNNVEVIEYEAFAGAHFSDITFGSSLKELKEYAFANGYDGEELIFNEGLEFYGNSVFVGCPNVKTIVIPGTCKKIDNGAFTGMYVSNIILNEGIEELGYSIFMGCSNLKSVTIPGSVKKLPSGLFTSVALQEIILSEGIEEINSGTFDTSKYSVKKLSLPGSLVNIPDELLSNGSSLEELILGEGIKEIGNRTFAYCNNLAKLQLPTTLEEIGEYAFYNDGKFDYDLSSLNNLKSIGQYAFGYCQGITKIVLPSSLENIEQGAFYYCMGATLIDIHGSFDTIPQYAFQNATSLREVYIGDNIKTIRSGAFYTCPYLFSVVLGENVETISDGAFSSCYFLKLIYNNSELELVPGSSNYGQIALYAKCIIKEGEDLTFINDNGFLFEQTETSYQLIGYIGSEENITLPTSFKDKDDNVITEFTINRYAFRNNQTIKSVVIPDSYTEIPDSFFYGCTNLESVTIGSGITSLEYGLFYGSGLKSVVIPDTITYLDKDVFRYCKSLKSITIGSGIDNIPMYSFAGCESLESITIPNTVTSLGAYCFMYSGLKSITLGTGLTELPSYAFQYAEKLESITIPANITSIGSYAFQYCKGLKSFKLEANDAVISPYMFDQCNGLEEVVLTDNIVSIGDHSFNACANLRKVKCGSGLKTIGYYAFNYCTNLEEVEFNNGLTSIDSNAFYYTKLESIVLPNSLTSIGTSAFSNCSNLKSVKLSSALTSIPDNLFYNDRNLETVDFNGADVTSIGQYAFYQCYCLDNITLPNTLESIGYSAFYDCIGLTSIAIPDSVTTLSNYAFYNCHSLEDLSLGKSIQSCYYVFNSCTNLKNVYYNIANLPDYSNGSGIFYSTGSKNALVITIGKDVVKLPQYIFSGYNSSGSYTYPKISSITVEANSALETIAEYAFRYNKSEFSVDLGDANCDINKNAFTECNITKFIGSNIKSVGQSAFSSSTKLKEAKVSGILGSSAFYYCISLETLDLGSATYIDNSCFNSCTSLKQLNIPATVTNINNNAFNGCQALEKITINGNITYSHTYNSNSPFYYLNGLKEVVFNDGVTEVADYLFSYCSMLKKVTFAETITRIGKQSFYACGRLDNITLPSNLETIGDSAFYNCVAIDRITLPQTLTTIGDYAFYNCTSLYSVRNLSSLGVTLNASTFGYVAYYALELLNGDEESTLFTIDGKFMFIKDKNDIYWLVKYLGTDKDVVLPSDFISGVEGHEDETVKEYQIRCYAFDGNENIETLVISDNVKRINAYAFRDLFNLKELTIGKNIAYIETGVFENTYSLELINYNATNMAKVNNDFIFKDAGKNSNGVVVNISSNVTTLPNYFLSSNDSSKPNKIVEVNFDNECALTSIGSNAFCYCTQLESIEIPHTVTSIGQSAFYYCINLKNVVMPDSLTVINNNTFYQCYSLLGITIPEGVTTIGTTAFYNCSKFNEVTLPSTVKTIGIQAFRGCSNLEVINLPYGMATIDNYAFYECSSLKNVIMPNTVTSIGYCCFYGCTSLESVDLSTSIKIIPQSCFYNCNKLTDIIIPDPVTTIDYSAFYDCKSLRTVTLPSQLKSILTNAFRGCSSLESIHAYDLLTQINTYAFYDCTSLEEVLIESDTLDIYSYAFYNCNNLEEFITYGNINKLEQYAFYNCKKLKELNIGYGLSEIGNYAFGNSGLESFIVPDTVTNIGISAFISCASLTNIYLPDTITVLNTYVFYNSGLEELIIPEGVTTINEYAISGLTNLKVLSLPSTLTTVNSLDFSYYELEEVHVKVYFKNMMFYSDNIDKVYVDDNEVAEDLLHSEAFGSLIKNNTELYIKEGLYITDYVTDNYETSGTVTIDDTLYTKFIRK